MSASTVRCRACCADSLERILDLGPMPLASMWLTDTQPTPPGPTNPLSLVYCSRCALVQLLDRGPAEQPDGEDPAGSPGTDARSLVRRLIKERRLTGDSLVVEASCGDGRLLQPYRDAGIPVLGIEPARNQAALAMERGITVLCDSFDEALAEELGANWRQADVIHANKVLDHAPDLNGFVRGLARLLKCEGVAVVEAPYVRDLVERRAVDAIRHDRLSYFSLTTLDALFGRGGLVLADVERTPAEGGSLRAFALRADAPDACRSAAVYALLAEERALRMHRPEYYHVFADRVRALNGTTAGDPSLCA